MKKHVKNKKINNRHYNEIQKHKQIIFLNKNKMNCSKKNVHS